MISQLPLALKISFVSVLFFLTPAGLLADSTDNAKTRFEILMNITNTLSRFAGNNGAQSIFDDPFVFGVKITNREKLMALRFGINFNAKKSTSDNSGIQKQSVVNSWAPLLGVEFRNKLNARFEFYGGMDVRYYNDLNRTTTVNMNNSPSTKTIFSNSQKGWGFGPFVGFVFNITPRVSLLTEGNFYFNFINLQRTFSDDGTHFDVYEDTKISNITPTAPSALFLIIRI